MRYKVYKSDNMLIAYNGVLWGLLTGVTGGAVYAVAAFILKTEIQKGIILGVLLAAVVISIVIAFLTNFTAIEVSNEEITLVNRGSLFRRFLLMEDRVGTFIEIQGILGVGYFVKRYLKINDKRYACHNFSRRTFSEMSSGIEYLRRRQAIGENENAVLTETAFKLPCENILANEQRKGRQFYGECIVVAVLMVVVWYFAVRTRVDWSFFMQYGVLVFLLLSFLIMPITLQGLSIRRYRENLPQKVILKENSIQVDDKVFAFDEIQSIRMTPVSYNFSSSYSIRRVLLIEQGGAVFRCYLGGAQTKEPQFEEYEQLQKIIVKLCDHNQTAFVLEL